MSTTTSTLKPERIQNTLKPERIQNNLTLLPEATAEFLATHADWDFEDLRPSIVCRFSLPTYGAACDFGRYAYEMAKTVTSKPRMRAEVIDNRVEIRIAAELSFDLSADEVALARLLDEQRRLLNTRPGATKQHETQA